MKYAAHSFALLMLCCSAGAQAQLYKSVGPDGKVTYSDTPPPAAKGSRVQTKPLAGGGNAVDLPFELAEAARGNPVVLYTTKNCVPCDDGKKLLGERGVPFTEKTVNTGEDMAQFKKVSSDGQLPVLLIGRSKERGYEPSAWNTALSAAGYPESNKLPKTYRNPPPEAVAPVEKPPLTKDAPGANRTTENSTGATEAPPPTGNAPPGFRF